MLHLRYISYVYSMYCVISIKIIYQYILKVSRYVQLKIIFNSAVQVLGSQWRSNRFNNIYQAIIPPSFTQRAA